MIGASGLHFFWSIFFRLSFSSVDDTQIVMAHSVTAGFAQIADAADTKTACSFGPLVDEIRKSFKSGKTKDLKWRKQQLTALCNLIKENHEMITAAVRADLGGGRARGLAELLPCADVPHAYHPCTASSP